MDIKSLNAYNASLLDYLGKGKTGNYFESVAQNLLSAYAGGQQAQNQAAAERIFNFIEVLKKVMKQKGYS